MKVIDMRSDRRLSGHGPSRRRAGVDRVELPKQARVAWVEQIRFLAGRAFDRQVWVYRQRFAQMREPAVIGPQTADEVLDYVQSPGLGPA